MSNRDRALLQQITCDRSWPYCIFDFTAMQTVTDNFVFMVGPKRKNQQSVSSDEERQNDLNEFVVDFDYVAYESRRQKEKGIIYYSSDDEESRPVQEELKDPKEAKEKHKPHEMS